MKSLKYVLIAGAFAAAGLSLNVRAQAAPSEATAKASTSAMTEAEVRKVNKETKKITLKHAAIKNLDMPPMTMVFQVSDAAMLDKVKAGDKVLFAAKDEGGKITVTEIQTVK